MIPFRQIAEIHNYLGEKGIRNLVPYRVDDLKEAFLRVTNVDRIYFIEVDQPVSQTGVTFVNGMLQTYERHEAPYGELITVADIYFLSQLSPCVRQFVVCKEMCQLFWYMNHEMRVSSAVDLVSLVEAISLPLQSTNLIQPHLPIVSESLSIVAAVELLCPFETRDRIICKSNGTKVDLNFIEENFRIPAEYARIWFDERFHDIIRRLYNTS